ncbi:hypothetical protein ACF1BE_26180 [Streptomyces sp. NPDC014991]|uniref:hypothetical protein n=1 Tax=Streptomyces sp. NPDC014991 TaxID=3364935 RepID=UPI0036F70DF7
MAEGVAGDDPGPARDLFRARRPRRETLWAYSVGLLVAADAGGWLPSGTAALASVLTVALAKETLYRTK